MSVFDKKVEASDLSGGGNSFDFKVLDEGWYPLTPAKAEGRTTKAGQAKLSIQWKVCTEEGNPDSATRTSVFQDILLPLFENEDAFKEDLAAKKGLSADEVEAAFAERCARDESNAAKAAFAIFGYEHFCAVPRFNRETKRKEMPDGSPVSEAEAQEYYKARNAEALNALLAVARGDDDLTRYMVAGKLAIDEYQGKKQNRVLFINAKLPTDAEFVKLS